MSQRGKRRATAPPPPQRRWRLIALGVVVLGAVTGGAVWGWLGREEAAAGTPRLAVDRTAVDLGDRRFDTPARVDFLLTNAGDGSLRLREVPRVRVAAGC